MIDVTGSIRFLYFDVGKVILHFDWAHTHRQMAELSGIPAQRVCEILEGEGLQRRYEMGELSSSQFYESYCQAAGQRLEYESLLKAACPTFRLNVPLVPVITQLAAANRRLGLLSNTCEAHWNYYSNGRYDIIQNDFEVQFLSFREKCMKPDKRIYAAAVE